ncbi:MULTISPECIES: tyrosine-type recombinase/integrase [Vibrio]|uniref:tyrosine-type recombinase/integrase n=1 Tax=Vibrio TaxID=662 RepID=UPI000420EB51|nr:MULTISPECIES: site-specific integrase [Vibrio]EHK7585910.1 site-specific integrase [Vibrio parahaemolyticus]MCZ6313879.1 site-specific integrase [Vibrio parahaemolyticus]MDW1660255.1 site-specific integrase [Vibrio sp. Vb2658]
MSHLCSSDNGLKLSQNPRHFSLETIRLSEDFQIDGIGLPRLPFVLDQDGRPHKVINDFIRYRAVEQRMDIDSTIYQDTLNIVKTYNALAQLVRGVETRWSMHGGVDINIASTSNKFHDCWLNSSRSRFRRILRTWKVEKEKNGYNPNTLNSYIRAFVRFLWWTNKKGYSQNLIGIHGQGTPTYPVPVEKPRSSKKSITRADYHIAWLLDEPISTPRKKRAIINKADLALRSTFERSENEKLSERSNIVAERDYLMLRLMREAGARVSEMTSLKKAAFLENPRYDETGNVVIIDTSETKGRGKYSRPLEVPKDLYISIRDYIEEEISDDLIPNTRAGKLSKADEEYLFPSSKTGKPLQRQAMNKKLKPFDLSPHDFRKISATEFGLVCINAGFDKPTSLLLIGEFLGHSSRSRGQTAEYHYTLAFEMCQRDKMGSIGSLKADLIAKDVTIEKLTKEVEELKKKISEQ